MSGRETMPTKPTVLTALPTANAGRAVGPTGRGRDQAQSVGERIAGRGRSDRGSAWLMAGSASRAFRCPRASTQTARTWSCGSFR